MNFKEHDKGKFLQPVTVDTGMRAGVREMRGEYVCVYAGMNKLQAPSVIDFSEIKNTYIFT